MLKLFDREDGKAADWPLIARTLSAEMFYALDQSPGDARVQALLQEVHDASYQRVTGGPPKGNEPACDEARVEAVGSFNLQSRPGHDEAPK
jgi:hypothetical protein